MKIRKISFLLILLFFMFLTGCSHRNTTKIETPLFAISWPSSSISSWNYIMKPDEKPIEIKFPVFEIDGRQMPAILSSLNQFGELASLRNGEREYIYEGTFQNDTSLRLQIKFQVTSNNPVIRFCYMLKSSGEQKLTKNSGTDNLVYSSFSMEDFHNIKEIRLSVFNEMIHSCNLDETKVYETDFVYSGSLVGPILIGKNEKVTFLCAYEHDSMYPNNFLEYQLSPDKKVELIAHKGNYFNGQPVNDYSTIWFEVGVVPGNEAEMAKQFRTFMHKYQSENTESRKPYIYYNTWGRQERVKWDGGKYLTTMNLNYTLNEIDRAHEMGIEYYVLDAGWFDRAGDWGVNLNNFPDGFKQINEKLERYEMKLGVWMNPAKAAITSQAFQKNKDCIKTWNGKPGKPSLVWETEESVDFCLVSPYWEYYAEQLIYLYTELGMNYFYLDGVGQSGCDDPSHFHGTKQNTREERQQSYGFLLPVYLGKIMKKVCAACPDAIFDFDVTEDRRIGVGLQFLANGRYFIMNNGHYFHNFDLCKRGETILSNDCRNIFINPGPARTCFMRSVLGYDKWIPSNLFMANYKADNPESSQLINLASLILGQNAIWGEILKTSPEGVALFHNILEKYKQVRDDIVVASPIHIGNQGGTPEIYEKINPETGKGVVVIFANKKGNFSYITKNKVVADVWHSKGAKMEINTGNHAKIEVVFNEASVAIIFFGVR